MVALSDVLEHGDPDRRRRRWLTQRSTAIVVTGVLLGGAGFALARWAGTGGHAPRFVAPPVSPSASPSAEVGSTTQTRRIGAVPVAAGDRVELTLVPGGAWLSSWTTGTLTRVAVGRKPRVTTRVRVGRPDESVLSMVYGAGSLWVVDASTNSVLVLDAATGMLQRRRQFGRCGVADTVAFGAHSVFVACSGQIGNTGPRERVLRVDPTSLRVAGIVALPGEGENLAVVANGTEVWAAGATPLVHIVAGMRTAVTKRPIDSTPLAVNGRTVWTASPNGLEALDARTGRVLVNSDLRGPPTVLAVDPNGRAWTVSPSANAGVDMLRPTGSLYRFAQYAGQVDGIAVDERALWIYTGSKVIVFDIGRMGIT